MKNGQLAVSGMRLRTKTHEHPFKPCGARGKAGQKLIKRFASKQKHQGGGRSYQYQDQLPT